MIKKRHLGLAILFFTLLSCGSSKDSIIPYSESIDLDEAYTIIWYGKSEVYRYSDGKWVRTEENDYSFTVTQKRFKNRWESVKTLHRVHPDFNETFGDRNQTMYFEVDYYEKKDDTVYANVTSTLGDGEVKTDEEFRESVITMYPETNIFMPYNKYRITQHYDYEKGILTETVELLKEEDGKETPLMKNEETAYFFVKGELNKAPTKYE
ncbi:MAG: hypothetical protein WEA99_06810 [Brumimicrobium sp.]